MYHFPEVLVKHAFLVPAVRRTYVYIVHALKKIAEAYFNSDYLQVVE